MCFGLLIPFDLALTTGGTRLVSSGVTLDLLGLSPPQVFPVCGSIPGRQLTAGPGSYSDSSSVTLTSYRAAAGNARLLTAA